MFSLLTVYLAKKTTLIFPSSRELWDFFKLAEIKEFRLDCAKCSVTGRFLPHEIELAKEKMNAQVQEEINNSSEFLLH